MHTEPIRPRTGGHVLLVDDDDNVRRAYSKLLSSLGCTVEAAADGEDAVEKLRAASFDLIVSDVNMPKMSGTQFLRAVRERDLDVPVILMTGAPVLETAVGAVEYGAFRYLTKPVAFDTFAQVVRSAIDLHELARLKREALHTVVRLDRQGRITHVNEAWRTFARENGADAATIEGVGLDYLAAARGAGDEGSTALAAGLGEMLEGRVGAFTHTYSCHAPSELRWFRVDAERVTADDALVLVHTNITQQRIDEGRSRVRNVMARAVGDHLPLVETCRQLARATCEHLEWDVAATWIPEGTDSQRLRCGEVWSQPSRPFAAFEAATRGALCELGRDLPGRAWAERSPEWISNLTEDSITARAPLAVADGLRTGLAVPLVAEGEVFAVIELFSRIQREPDPSILELLAVAGMQLGTKLLRERAEARAATAEWARRSVTSMLDAIMECAPAFILVVDVKGRIQFINRLLSHLKREDLIGTDWTLQVPLEHRDLVRSRLRALLETGLPQTFETSLIGPEGSKLWFTTHLGPMREGDQIVGAVAVSQDVTELKLVQAEAVVAHRMAAVGTLAAGVAHEINTPVQFVNDSVHFLRDAARDVFGLVDKLQTVRGLAARGTPDPELAEAIDAVRAAEKDADLGYLVDNIPKAFERSIDGLERISSIVRSMKEFAHPAQREMAAADLNRAIRNTLTIARNEYKYVAELETDLGDLPLVTCHVNDINQVVLNLVVNAAHAIGDVVKGTDSKGILRVRSWQDSDWVVVSVADTGSGIRPEHANRIFEPFFTTKDVGKGTGQGLALAWSVVTDKHGGQLSFESKVGEGTTFFVRLPVSGKKPKSEVGVRV